jgi:hypothetical protein
MMDNTANFCIVCGYDQRGIEQRCPECGAEHAKYPPSPTRIRWSHRRYFGRLRTFWATVFRATVFPERIAEEIEHPVSYTDARRYWAVVIVHVYLPLLLFAAALKLPRSLYPHGDFPPAWRPIEAGLFLKVLAPIWVGPVAMLGILLFVISATGLPSYFCCTRATDASKRSRAIALSYYATGPLALWPVAMGAYVAATLMEWKYPGLVPPAMAPLALITLGGVTLLAYLQCLLRLLVRLRGGSRGQLVRLVVLLPVAWAVAAGICLVLVPVLLQLCLIYVHVIMEPG